MGKIILMLGLMFSLLTNDVSAEKFLIEANGYHTVSRKETIEFAEDAAVDNALKWAVEQIGVRISAYSEVVNKVLREDTVKRFASSVVQIKEKTLTPRIVNEDYRIYAHVICIVDTADLDKWEPSDIERQRKLEEDKARLEVENQKLAQEKQLLEGKVQRIEQRAEKAEQMVQQGIPSSEYIMLGNKALREVKNLTPMETLHAEAQYSSAWMKDKTNAVPIARIAAIEWNRKNYEKFVRLITMTRDCSNNQWWIELYHKWIIPGTVIPFANAPKKIDLMAFIQDTTACVPYKGRGL